MWHSRSQSVCYPHSVDGDCLTAISRALGTRGRCVSSNSHNGGAMPTAPPDAATGRILQPAASRDGPHRHLVGTSHRRLSTARIAAEADVREARVAGTPLGPLPMIHVRRGYAAGSRCTRRTWVRQCQGHRASRPRGGQARLEPSGMGPADAAARSGLQGAAEGQGPPTSG